MGEIMKLNLFVAAVVAASISTASFADGGKTDGANALPPTTTNGTAGLVCMYDAKEFSLGARICIYKAHVQDCQPNAPTNPSSASWSDPKEESGSECQVGIGDRRIAK